MSQALAYPVEDVAISDLTPHPRNYRNHPEDQLRHLADSIRDHGFYRNIAVARDGTILAGHGVVQASLLLGLSVVPVVRLDLDPNEPRALKLLAGDNEIAKLAEVDDRALTELLREIGETHDGGLLGTGFDETMLAGLVMVSRPESEIEGFDAAAEWAGMPEYDTEPGEFYELRVKVWKEEDLNALIKKEGFIILKKVGKKWSTWYPPREQDDLASVMVEG